MLMSFVLDTPHSTLFILCHTILGTMKKCLLIALSVAVADLLQMRQ
jgi:hypothetical protein